MPAKEAPITHRFETRPARQEYPLVGRADELESLEQALDEVERGPPGAIELVGEPGIGKTRLLAELSARAELRGDLVLAAANEALRKARELVASEMSRVAGGLGAKIPGLM